MEKKEQEVAEEYLSSLADLNLNSKPLINMLTILAEENIEFAPVIVRAVEQHIAKVNADVKLPVLYLIDSIVKNVGREYVQLFSHSIVNIFCGVFEKVNEKIREKMYTLRQTWNDVFTPQKLYTLDVKVNCMDPNWPITAKVVPKSPAIHVNPNFLKNKGEPLNEMEAKLRDKQRQLLELQKRKLELELAATKQRLEEQEKQLQSTIQTDTTKPPTTTTAATVVHPTIAVKSALNGPQTKSQQSKMLPSANVPAMMVPNAANNMTSKIRVAPVNSALLNSVRQRDPRLARQQQQQQAAAAALAAATSQQQSMSTNTIPEMPPIGLMSSGSATLETPRADNNVERSQQKSLTKSGMVGSVARERSKDVAPYNVGTIKRQQRRNFEKSSYMDGKKSPTANVQLSPTSGSRSARNHSSISSSSRNSAMSRSREPHSKSSNSREKLALSYERERKRKNELSSPIKSGKSPKRSEKSPKRYADHLSKLPPSAASSATSGATVPGSPTKFPDAGKQQHIKSRNYMRRNREKSASPQPPSPPTTSNHYSGDLRETVPSAASPEKRTKISARSDLPTLDSVGNSNMIATTIAPTTVTASVANVVKVESGNSYTPLSVTLAAPSAATSSNVKAEKLEQSVELTTTSAASIGDIDLRQLHTNAVASLQGPNTIGTATTTPATESVNSNNNSAQMESPEDADSKKRAANKDAEEPVPKKTRSEKIDPLFGTEDVDLRTLNAPGNHINATVPTSMPSTPPPPPIISNESENWAKVKGDKPNKQPHPLPKSKLDDVRAKLAKATKEHKSEKELKSFKKASRFNETHDDSQDGTDTNIRTIMTQAQEMLQSDNMDYDQYNTLVKTVIQINETSKLKEAQRRESLLVRKDGNEDLTPISDEEVPFSSDDESTQSSLKSSKAKVLSKRIPKVVRKDENAPVDIKFEQNSVLRRSPTPTAGGAGNSYSEGNNRVQPGAAQQGTTKSEKRSRQKDSKWSRWDPPTVPPQQALNNNKNKWVVGNTTFRPPFPGSMDNAPNEMVTRSAVPSPWQNPPQIIFAGPPIQNRILPPPPPIPPMVSPMIGPDRSTITPGPPIPPPMILPPLSNSVDNPNADVVRTINIDGVPKEIRFYDEIAIAFMDWDQPKEIGFQAGQRKIFIDDHEVATLSFNDAYKSVMVDGNPHQMRFGCPTRELYIDKNWYECYFGDPPIRICLDGRMRVCKVDGPSPQVRIGNTRQDLVIGKINMIVDALIIVPVFLDAKVQSFQLDATTHTVQFADNLNTVLINNIPFDVEYGGLPKSMYLNGVKHFVRFGTLPKGIVPGGNVRIQNMIRTERFNSIEPPLSSPQEQKPSVAISAQMPSVEATLPAIGDVKPQVPVENSAEITGPIKTDPIVPPIANVNIDDLFQKLLASGILNQNSDANKADEGKKEKKDKPITPIDLSRPETIKTRQAGIIQKLFSGMQCSSCGVRFPPEQTMKYSQHLDWHFRQNRKERDNSRRAHSRKWYYDVSDWIQYEEIEDLEEREKNWFETQQNDLDNVDENSNQRTNSPPPSCPAGPDNVEKCCDMCHDQFEQFYNEESEEWHLRNAVRVEDKLYHPICYEDYKASLTMALDESNLALGDDNAVDEAVVKIEKKDESAEGENVEIATIDDDDDDEDDVIVLPAEEPSIQEIPDDDEDVVIEHSTLETELLVPDSEASEKTEEGEKAANNGEAMESDDVQIQEPHIPFTDLDMYEETAAQSVSTVDDSSQSSIKIKEEPKDDGYNEDDDFEEVGTIMCADEISNQTDDIVTVVPTPVIVSPPAPAAPKPPITSASNSNILILHDPTTSAECDENHSTTTLGSNKIKINISTSAIRSESAVTTAQSSSGIPSSTADESSTGNDNVAASGATSQEQDDDFYDSIKYTLKPTLQNVPLKKTPRTVSGLETSGLCSIM